MRNLYYESGEPYAVFSDEKREFFYQGGILKTLEPYKGGKLHGEVCLFWPCGTFKRRCFFEEGLRQGSDQMWNQEGVLVDEGSYEKGKPVGIHRRFSSKGALIEEIEYLGPPNRFNLREWDEKGQIKVEALWNDLDYHERVWDRFQNFWVEKDGYWDGKQLVYL